MNTRNNLVKENINRRKINATVDLAIVYHRPESLLLKLKTPKTTKVKKNQRYQLAEHISVDAEKMMKTACTGLPLAVWKDTIVLPQQKKSYGVTVSVGLLIIVWKHNQCQNFFQLYLVKINVFCNSTKIYYIQKVSNEKKRIFLPSKFLLKQKTHKVELHLLVIIFVSFFFVFVFQTQSCNLGTHQHGIKLRHECNNIWVLHEMLISCMRFRERFFYFYIYFKRMVR